MAHYADISHARETLGQAFPQAAQLTEARNRARSTSNSVRWRNPNNLPNEPTLKLIPHRTVESEPETQPELRVPDLASGPTRLSNVPGDQPAMASLGSHKGVKRCVTSPRRYSLPPPRSRTSKPAVTWQVRHRPDEVQQANCLQPLTLISHFCIVRITAWIDEPGCLPRYCTMSAMADDSPGASRHSEQHTPRLSSDDHLAMQKIIPGNLQEDQRRRDALRGLAMAAEAWTEVADLLPHLGLIQSFTAAVLDQAIRELPHLENFQDWLPPNWLPKPELNLAAAMTVLESGIPLIWVPPAPVVSDLLAARDPDERNGILTDRIGFISEHCLEVLDEVTEPRLEPLARMAKQSVASLELGLPGPAQALAANIFDTWLYEARNRGILFQPSGPASVYAQLRKHVGPVSAEILLRRFREVCVLSPAAAALVDYKPPGGPSPPQFSRHATVHYARPESYTPARAVIAVMLSSSVLREAQEHDW